LDQIALSSHVQTIAQDMVCAFRTSVTVTRDGQV